MSIKKSLSACVSFATLERRLSGILAMTLVVIALLSLAIIRPEMDGVQQVFSQMRVA